MKFLINAQYFEGNRNGMFERMHFNVVIFTLFIIIGEYVIAGPVRIGNIKMCLYDPETH